MSFEKNLFINCPFDEKYRTLLKPMIFTIRYYGLQPVFSTTVSSGHIRIEEIMKLIQASKFSIHDISRNRALKRGDIARFNMPYEMGLDIGCQKFGDKLRKTKKCLILDYDAHTYDVALSDISGQDIKAHNDDPQTLINKVREWLIAVFQRRLANGNTVWVDYCEFLADIEEQLLAEGWKKREIKNLSTMEFSLMAKEWIKAKLS